MDNYKEELNKYNITLRTCAGCGNRAQVYIENAYNDLHEAWSKLTQEERNNNPLPPKEACKDDGTGGVSSGISSLAEQDGCTIV